MPASECSPRALDAHLACAQHAPRLLVHSLAPNVLGHELVKFGLLLSLFGGNDSAHQRGAIHVAVANERAETINELIQACVQVRASGRGRAMLQLGTRRNLLFTLLISFALPFFCSLLSLLLTPSCVSLTLVCLSHWCSHRVRRTTSRSSSTPRIPSHSSTKALCSFRVSCNENTLPAVRRR